MGGRSTKIQHEYINRPDSVVEESTTGGFHVLELHMETVKFSLVGLIVLACIVVACFYLWRRCRRNIQRRQWRRVLGRQDGMPGQVLPLATVRYNDPVVPPLPAITSRPLLFHEAHASNVPSDRIYPLLGSGRLDAPLSRVNNVADLQEMPPLPKNL